MAFHRLGAFCYRRRWWVIGAWILLFALSMPFVAKLTERLSNGGFEVPGSQSDQVRIALQTEFESQSQFSDLLVLSSDSLTATDAEFRSTFEKVKAELMKAPGVGSVSDPYAAPDRTISRDGHTAIAQVALTDTQDESLKHADEVDAAVARGSRGTQVDALITGAAPFYAAFTETTEKDLKRAESFALPISIIILVIAFGSLVAAGVPVALALLSLVISFGMVSIIAAQTTVSVFTQNIASMIGIGVGIDYSLFILTRYRTELKGTSTVADAIADAMATSGKAVFVSALTVAVALSGTLLVNLAAFRSMGMGSMIAVAMAGAAALTLLPALLGVLGERVNKLSVHRKERQSGALWHRWATAVMKRPWVALIASLLLMGILAAPARDLRLGSSGPDILPPEATAKRALDVLAKAFGEGEVGPAQIVLKDVRGPKDGAFEDLSAVAGRIAEDPEVTRVESIFTLTPGLPPEAAKAALASPQVAPFADRLTSTDDKSTLLRVVTKHGPQSLQSAEFVRRMRALLPQILPAGARGLVGGDPGLNTDIDEEVETRLPYVVALVMTLSFLVLLLFFRSLVIPLKAILMNTASVLAAYGLLVWVFQKGHLEGLLGFESQGHVESFLPLFLFCILFGLSMDYEVFLLARIREEYLRTGDNTEAVGWGLEHTARIITSAAAIMITVFGAFAFARLVPIKAMGFGLAVAVFLDATVIRVVMVPATMRLMGKWNWWIPRWLDRILPNVSLEESAPARAWS